MSKHNALRCLCEGAICVALATILGLIRFYRMPNGGSVTMNMLPLFIFAIRWGVGPGLLAGFLMGLLDFVLGGSYIIGWQSLIGDYLLAYTFCGLAGLFKGRSRGIFAGSVAGAIGRWIVLWVTGATVWAINAPEVLLGMTITSPWFYSAIYNGIHIGLSLAICLVLEAAALKPLRKYFLGEDIKKA